MGGGEGSYWFNSESMSREIKFRAWDKVDERWVDDFASFCRRVENQPPLDVLSLISSNGSVVFCQYTGLKDKNGVEIFEGDILQVSLKNEFGSHETFVGEVTYIENIAMFNVMVEKYEGRLGFEFYKFDVGEVIGNIHQHPELLNP